MERPVHAAVDAGALTSLAGVLLGVLPHITVVLSFVWAVGRLFEMFTGTPVHETKWVRASLGRLKAWRSG